MLKRGDRVKIKTLEDRVFIFQSMAITPLDEKSRGVGEVSENFALKAVINPAFPMVIDGLKVNEHSTVVIDASKIEMVDFGRN